MLGDTVWALSSAPGESARAVIRVSGPRAFEQCSGLLASGRIERRRGLQQVSLQVLDMPFDASALCMPAPASFTGEDVVELHTPGSPLLVRQLGKGLEEAGARAATPGEFTRRAFENGRLDLLGAEAVLALVHADSTATAAQALRGVRGGGIVESVAAVRERLLGIAALLEAGLDFDAGETGEVPVSAWLPSLQECSAALGALHGQLPRGRVGGGVMLIGRANAGKSALCNALVGRDSVLVADRPGTTRDVVTVEVDGVELLDAPGDLASGDSSTGDSSTGDSAAADSAVSATDAAALALRSRLAARCVATLLVVDPRDGLPAPTCPEGFPAPVGIVGTHADLNPSAPWPAGLPDALPRFRVASPTGAGLPELRRFLSQWAGAGGGAPHAAAGSGRIQSLVETAEDAVRRALQAGTDSGGVEAELIALDLVTALEALGELTGVESVSEAVLDGVFGRFCLGK